MVVLVLIDGSEQKVPHLVSWADHVVRQYGAHNTRAVSAPTTSTRGVHSVSNERSVVHFDDRIVDLDVLPL
jgi:hypothetical protein